MFHETASEAKRIRKRLPWIFQVLIVAGLVLAGVSTWGYARFGSIGSALAFARGDRLIAETKSLSFGPVLAGPTIQQHTRLTNYSNRTIKLVGSNASCSCVLSEDLPLTLAPGESHLFKIGVKTDQRTGLIRERVVVYTDYPEQSGIAFTVKGEVISTASRGQSNETSTESQ